MKKILFTLFAVIALPILAGQSIDGQRTLRVDPVTWNVGANTGKTRLKFVSPDSSTFGVWLDTSATGQAGSWRRIDTASDSCSQPFLITSDTSGIIRPIWEYALWQITKAADPDSSTHVYRVQTRERQFLGPLPGKRIAGWTPWTVKGANAGYADVTIQDSVLISNALSTGKVSQYSLFSVVGVQARLCPDAVAGHALNVADSTIADSLRVRVR